MCDSRPSAEKQVEIFRELETDNMVKSGEDAFLISSKWLENWKQIVGYNNNEAEPEKENDIGPIDNSSLVIDGMLDTSSSFSFLPKKVWKQLVSWYGGGPEVKVPTGKGTDIVVDMFKLSCTYGKKTEEIIVHKHLLSSDVKKKALQIFGLPENTISRLIDFYGNKFYAIIDNEKTLAGNNITMSQPIILDTKKSEDSKWKNHKLEENHNKPSSNTFGYSSGYYNGYGGYNSGYSYGRAQAPGIVGLSNLGNTCFFNSGVQCLLHSVPLMKIFLQSNWKQDLNENNPIGMKGMMARIFAELMRKVWSGDQSVISPHDLKRVIGEFAPQFSGYGQQDSHELITFMLDGLHEDLNRCIEKPLINNIDGDGTNDEEIADLSWENFKKRNDSVIVDTFYGQYRSKLFCPSCQAITTVFDPYVAVSLPISKQKLTTRKLTFIPFDFSQEYQYLTIAVKSNASFKEISLEVSKQIGRDVNVAVGYKSYQTSVKWSIESESSYNTPTFYAFELPEGFNIQFFIPAIIVMNIDEGYYSSQPKEIAGPVLIPIRDVKSEKKDIAKSASEILDAIWRPCDKPLHSKVEKMLDRFKKPEEIDDKECRFKASYSLYDSNFSYYSDSLEADNARPYLSTKIAYLRFNPDFVDPKTGFNYASLLRHFRKEGSDSDDENRNRQSIDLSNCFQYFTLPDKLDDDNQWYCPKCREFVCADKKMDIWKVPKSLIIHLKRFISTEHSTQKDETFVSFPELLDLKKYVVGNQSDGEDSLMYRLYAVSEHSGYMGGGHYTAHAKVAKLDDINKNGSWYSFNDSSTSASSYEDTQSAEAYLLFYQRIDPNEGVDNLMGELRTNSQNDNESSETESSESEKENDDKESSESEKENDEKESSENENNCHFIGNNNNNNKESDSDSDNSSSSNKETYVYSISNNKKNHTYVDTSSSSD